MPKASIDLLTYNIFTKEIEWIKQIHKVKPLKEIELKQINKKDKRLYYKKVWDITLSHGVSNIMQGFECGSYKYHIDHIIPISYGYKNKINPELIGGFDNLRPLYWKDNFKKGALYPYN